MPAAGVKFANAPPTGARPVRRFSAGPWLLPAAALAIGIDLAPWQAMWLMVLALLAAFKWWSWRRARSRAAPVSRGRTLAYLFLWPGLDAERFLHSNPAVPKPGFRMWSAAFAAIGLGALVIWGVVPRIPADRPCLAGGIGFAGLLLLLHFGTCELLSLVWKSRGIDAEPLMRRPFQATSLADFWGRHWNSAYRRVSYDFIFRPLAARMGASRATLSAFFVSGLLHELVISIPARGGYGGPTLYFLAQFLGLLWERTPTMRTRLARQPLAGWFYTAAFLIGPVGLLFPPAFLTRVIVPFLKAIGI
jgi:alginate O-acetyltransferase complex protein AlgI